MREAPKLQAVRSKYQKGNLRYDLKATAAKTLETIEAGPTRKHLSLFTLPEGC